MSAGALSRALEVATVFQSLHNRLDLDQYLHRVPLITFYQRRGWGRPLFFPMFYKQGRPLFVILITDRSDNYQRHFFKSSS